MNSPWAGAVLWSLRGLAGRIEGIRRDFRHLPAGGIGAPAEVRAVAGRITGLPHTTTAVAVDDLPSGQLLNPIPEHIRDRYIFEGLLGGRDRIGELGGLRGDLGN